MTGGFLAAATICNPPRRTDEPKPCSYCPLDAPPLRVQALDDIERMPDEPVPAG